ncbi:hypothetical protein KJY78_05195 [Canibacter sp. lx-45]|uniref:hypothetical protein n=1 Tax=Canibacter zhuwentaonis TaxID=2837491 RepID=UPI001BDD3090|nr:hypothetical protein [Canibacter zhuwentaonis]MBT1035739.1 hypothetical protein [Canibacter zhuwentaonis]
MNIFSPSTEIVLTQQVSRKKRACGLGWRATAVFFVSLFAATVAIPAHAVTPNSEGALYSVKRGAVQEFFVSYADGVSDIAEVGAYSLDVVAQVAQTPVRNAGVPRGLSSAEQSARIAAAVNAAPAGSASVALLAAARAQLGVRQDCTDMVQNALAAIGYTTRRDQGGYDHGIMAFLRYGVVVPHADAQPGDIMIAPGFHVAIYAGNNTAVHGGYSGGNTVENSWRDSNPDTYAYIVRLQ